MFQPDEPCVACAAGTHAPRGGGAAADYSTWIACSHCGAWFHCRCLAMPDPAEFAEWHCGACEAHGYVSARRAPRRRSARAKPRTDYAAVDDGRPSAPLERWAAYMRASAALPDGARRVSGDTWTREWLLEADALAAPSMVGADEKARIAGLRVPPRDTSIDDICTLLGRHTPVEVIDVATQMSFTWTLGDWAAYFATPPAARERVLNIISLEVSGTALEPLVAPPAMVSESDWVERDWPATRRPRADDASLWPKVQRYVLMGVQGAFTDFHIDFAATMVFYSVVWGHKVFLFAPPTPRNLAAYRAWTSSARQASEWLGDALDGLTRVEIGTDETLFIPPGWIHAVHTTADSLVVGGNFLGDCGVPMHFRIEELEIATRVPRKFRFPHLVRLAWYVAAGWKARLSSADAALPARLADGLDALCRRLSTEVERLASDAAQPRAAKPQRLAHDAVPWDAVDDPAALVAALRALLRKRKREG